MTRADVVELLASIVEADLPERVYFCKGCVSVARPAGAVARLGGGANGSIVFLDRSGNPFACYAAVGRHGTWSVVERSVFSVDRIQETRCLPGPCWEDVRPLGKSRADILFGVHG